MPISNSLQKMGFYGIILKGENMLKKIIVATNNKNKAREIREIMPQCEVLTLEDINFLDDIEENGETFLENAIIKAKAISALTDEVILADDSGLEVDFLNGAPGVHSKRFADSDNERIEKMLALLGGTPERKARFKCAVALVRHGELIADFEGILEGSIAYSQSGNNGFGYDPIFIPDGYDVTLACLTADEKNRISHRGQAFTKFSESLTYPFTLKLLLAFKRGGI